MESSLPMEYLQGLLRLALHQSQSVDQQLGDIGPSVKSDPFSRSSNFKPTSKAVSALTPPSHAVDTDTEININEERLLARFETNFDNKLRDFQERFIEPLAIGILRIEKQCSQFEARMLLNPGLIKQPPNDTALPPLRPSMPGSYRPSRSSGSSVASFCEDVPESLTMDSKNQQTSTKTMQMVANLLAQIGKDGLSSDIPTITLGDKISSVKETSTNSSRRTKPRVMDDRASDWSDSVFGGDWKGVKPARSKSTKPKTAKDNTASKYVIPEEKKVADTLVIVEPTSVAVRSLNPRPCHKYYLSDFGCTNDHCLFSHDYRKSPTCHEKQIETEDDFRFTGNDLKGLNSDHIKYLRKLVEGLPCTAIKNGADCEDGEDCIYAHKCIYGWNCTYGETCRFFDIPGAHPDSGEFHKKKNYYDSSKNPPNEKEASGWGW